MVYKGHFSIKFEVSIIKHTGCTLKIVCTVCILTSPVCHGVEEAPGGVLAGAALDEGDVVRRLDADHGEQLHQQSRRRRVQGGVPAGRGDIQRSVP